MNCTLQIMDFLHLEYLALFVELQNSFFFQISIMVPVNSLREDAMNPVCFCSLDESLLYRLSYLLKKAF